MDYPVSYTHLDVYKRQHLYYLQSRGLTKAQAMHLITYGYLLPAIAKMNYQEVATRFEAMLEKKVGNA